MSALSGPAAALVLNLGAVNATTSTTCVCASFVDVINALQDSIVVEATRDQTKEARGIRAHRLAQPHLICEDAVDAVLVQRGEPLDAFDLVVAQLARHQRSEVLTGLQQLTLLVVEPEVGKEAVMLIVRVEGLGD